MKLILPAMTLSTDALINMPTGEQHTLDFGPFSITIRHSESGYWIANLNGHAGVWECHRQIEFAIGLIVMSYLNSCYQSGNLESSEQRDEAVQVLRKLSQTDQLQPISFDTDLDLSSIDKCLTFALGFAARLSQQTALETALERVRDLKAKSTALFESGMDGNLIASQYYKWIMAL